MIQVEQEGILQVHMVCILDQKRRQLQNRAIELVNVQWTYYSLEDATWEHEDAMWEEYPNHFEYLEILLILCK